MTEIKRGSVLRQALILRIHVQANRQTIYMFGDNLARKGLGGQAREMRHEPNTIGVITKKYPSNNEIAFMTDIAWQYPGIKILVEAAFLTAKLFLDAGVNIVIPEAGFGSGLADLKNRAPKMFADIERLTDGLIDYATEV